jgi:hypothetical protein
VSSITPPFDKWGSVRESQASFWVPVLAGHEHGGHFHVERFALSVPYILVDNPMSYAGGREVYGYAKSLGRFEPANALGDAVTVSAFGGDFESDSVAGWRPFFEISSGERSDGAEPDPRGPEDFLRDVAGGVLDRLSDLGDRLGLGRLRIERGALDNALALRVQQVFLKQFRDAHDVTSACYQATVEAPVDIARFDWRPSLLDPWQVTIHPLDSHPIAGELGVESQVAHLTYELDIDFTVEMGTITGGSG